MAIGMVVKAIMEMSLHIKYLTYYNNVILHISNHTSVPPILHMHHTIQLNFNRPILSYKSFFISYTSHFQMVVYRVVHLV